MESLIKNNEKYITCKITVGSTGNKKKIIIHEDAFLKYISEYNDKIFLKKDVVIYINSSEDELQEFFVVPKDKLSVKELFLLSCANDSNYCSRCNFRGFCLTYMLSTYFFDKFKEYRYKGVHDDENENQKDEFYGVNIYSIYTEILGLGLKDNDPSIDAVEKLYKWCILRHFEIESLTKRGYGIHNCYFSDDFFNHYC
jgi:hypothetical protein